MRPKLRRAFVVTGCLAATGCSPSATDSSPTNTTENGTATATGEPPAGAKLDLPLRDDEGRIIQRREDGTCFVHVAKKEPPPKDLMSGELWVDEKTLACPKAMEDPDLAAVPPGYTLIQDKDTGECSLMALFGNPPPPPKKTECPAALKKSP